MKSLKFASRCHCLSDTIGFIHPPFEQSFFWLNVSAFSSVLTEMLFPENPAFFARQSTTWTGFRTNKTTHGSPHWPARGLIVESAAKRAFLTCSSGWRFPKWRRKTALEIFLHKKTRLFSKYRLDKYIAVKAIKCKVYLQKKKSPGIGNPDFSPPLKKGGTQA